MRALLIANEHDGDTGVVGERLVEHGFRLELAPREDPLRWPALDAIELVLLLGSDWSVYWDHVAASVDAEASLVRAVHQRGTPLLAICFGAQVVSHALGGRVRRSPNPEIGWYPIEIHREGLDAGPWFQWHVDCFEVPDGFVQLASSAAGPQAMVAGRTLAVQFHPEVTESIVARWSSEGGVAELAAYGLSPDDVMSATREHAARARGAARALVDDFLEGRIQ